MFGQGPFVELEIFPDHCLVADEIFDAVVVIAKEHLGEGRMFGLRDEGPIRPEVTHRHFHHEVAHHGIFRLIGVAKRVIDWRQFGRIFIPSEVFPSRQAMLHGVAGTGFLACFRFGACALLGVAAIGLSFLIRRHVKIPSVWPDQAVFDSSSLPSRL